MHIPSRTTSQALLQKIQNHLSDSFVELVSVSHERWPLPRQRPGPGPLHASHEHVLRPLRISILDSSFNPPTLAHLALLNSPRPHYSLDKTRGSEQDITQWPDYDARLLLLSVRNADKQLKPVDASLVQRLEMMALLANDVRTYTHTRHNNPSIDGNMVPVSAEPDHLANSNIAVAVIDEPTFVGKSKRLLDFLTGRLAALKSLSDRQQLPLYRPELTFLLGFDTLERLFTPHYYASNAADGDCKESMFAALRKFMSPDGDDSRIVCAGRVSTSVPLLPPAPVLLQHGLDDAPLPSNNDSLLALGDKFELEGTSELKVPSGAGFGTGLFGSNKEAETLALAQEFITSERVVLVDIGENERTFSSSAVRNMIGDASMDEGRNVEWKSLYAPWRRLVPEQIADYIVQEGLYSTIRRD